MTKHTSNSINKLPQEKEKKTLKESTNLEQVMHCIDKIDVNV